LLRVSGREGPPVTNESGHFQVAGPPIELDEIMTDDSQLADSKGQRKMVVNRIPRVAFDGQEATIKDEQKLMMMMKKT
jgi:hypothetical protein